MEEPLCIEYTLINPSKNEQNLILFILASTSTDWAVKQIGYSRWKCIHRLAYLAALLIFYHQALQEKNGIVQTIYFFAPLAILEFLRVGKYVLKKSFNKY